MLCSYEENNRARSGGPRVDRKNQLSLTRLYDPKGVGGLKYDGLAIAMWRCACVFKNSNSLPIEGQKEELDVQLFR